MPRKRRDSEILTFSFLGLETPRRPVVEAVVVMTFPETACCSTTRAFFQKSFVALACERLTLNRMVSHKDVVRFTFVNAFERAEQSLCA